MLRRRDPDILLLSQVFPPAVGGSGELLENVYSRIAVPVTAWTDAGDDASAREATRVGGTGARR